MPRKHRTPESLALNRENQRRSRARHRELLEELQGRVRDYERRDAQATLDMQRVAREVAAENAALKGLLAAKGVPPDEVEAHLQAARMAVQTLPQPQLQPQLQPQIMPLNAREDLSDRRDILPDPPLRQVYYDPRLEMSQQQLSRTSPFSSSSITATPSISASIPVSRPVSASASVSSRASPIPIAPKPLQCLQPHASVPISPLSNVVPSRHPQHINSRSEFQPVRPSGCGGNGPSLMELDQPVGVPRSQPEPKPAGFPQPEPNQEPACCLNPRTGQVSTCQPQPNPHQQAQVPFASNPSASDPSNKMHCVEAATILARLRGYPDDNIALAALGCSDSKNCMVRNTDLLQLMDDMT